MRFSLSCSLGFIAITLSTAILQSVTFTAAAQSSPSALSTPTLSAKAPALTAQQLQAVHNMTPAQIAAYQAKIQPAIASLQSQIASHQPTTSTFSNWQNLLQGTATDGSTSVSSVSSSTLNFSTESGTSIAVPVSTGGYGTASAAAASRIPPPGGPICPVWGCGGPPKSPIGPFVDPDLDQDGLPDAFETSVANNFTPYYGPSAGDQQQFATFANSVPISITSLVGTVPPFSYYRVQPLGLATDSHNNQLFALRVDYLTLWNGDGGLVGGGAVCAYSYVGLDQVVQQLSGHYFDAERSGMLLAAPAVNGGYNPDPNAYSLYTLYTAAHEGTFFDQSDYINISPAAPAGSHVELALSLSKHSTYTFNPDFFPITPAWFIDAYFTAFEILYEEGVISDLEYAYAIFLGEDVFYGCLVERFSDQGVTEANQRVNVGEPAHPINGSTFIQDDSSRALNLSDKLTNPLF
jgi:hypothetical protein